jgi:hypothetical protein
VLELRTDDESRFTRAADALTGAIEVGAEPPASSSPIIDRVEPITDQ